LTRISRDELEYCSKETACFECHSGGNFTVAVKLQKRGRLKVPCCRKHFNAYRSKLNEAGARRYARRAADKRQAGECTYNNCRHKLIPKELLPPWWKRESTCGMHVAFKAFRVNREALLGFITQHCLTPEERENATAQNIIYNRGQGFILFGQQKPGVYHTKCFSASGLLERYERFRRRKSPPC
jgi:hypothetical protein